MLARWRGRRRGPRRRGEVFRVEAPRLEPGAGALRTVGSWTAALASAAALGAGRVVAAVGERGSGRTTLLAQAERAAPAGSDPGRHPPDPEDADTWLALWPPELGKPHTAVILCDVATCRCGWRSGCATWCCEAAPDSAEPATPSFSMTAERFEDMPAPLAGLVDTVVPVAPLRERPEDVLPLAHHADAAPRPRPDGARAAEQVLADHPWPGNVTQLSGWSRRPRCTRT